MAQDQDDEDRHPRWVRHRDSGGRSYRIKDAADLNRRRLEEDLSIAELGRMAGCSKSMAGFLCRGERDGVSEVLARRLAAALSCEPGDLVEEWQEPAGTSVT